MLESAYTVMETEGAVFIEYNVRGPVDGDPTPFPLTVTASFIDISATGGIIPVFYCTQSIINDSSDGVLNLD